jgi:hypothetical protein
MADDRATEQDQDQPEGARFLGPADVRLSVGAAFFYANSASVVGGPFDVALDFGYQSLGSAGPEAVTTWQARVAMSWEHARSLHSLLGRQIEAFESAVGNLPDTEKLRGGDPDDDDD